MDEYLWPTRNVAEFAYCPRLFYYMEVEGIHVPSADTTEGQRVHRRVDAPSNKKSEAGEDDGAPQSVRSLTLTSQTLGLTATLDLAEISGNEATPVEYRKGRPRAIYADGIESKKNGRTTPAKYEPWPTDRVQVGLQAILLEEAGYEVRRAILYYAGSRQRVEVVIDDQLRREALETLANAKSCAAGARPLPLVNDPRCPRCSLHAVCLPDEINAQRQRSTISSKNSGLPATTAFIWSLKREALASVFAEAQCK